MERRLCQSFYWAVRKVKDVIIEKLKEHKGKKLDLLQEGQKENWVQVMTKVVVVVVFGVSVEVSGRLLLLENLGKFCLTES